MNKQICCVLSALCLILCLAGCGNGHSIPAHDRLSIVTTISPSYDWAKQIIGEQTQEVDLTLLLQTNVDLHNYQPSVEDVVKIANCDLFIFVGGESDAWVKEVVAEASNPHLRTVDLLTVLGGNAKREELADGMEPEGVEEEDGPAYDEHVWLSLKNASLFCRTIADALCEIDPDNQAAYTANLNAYLGKLRTLDDAYAAAVAAAKRKEVLFADRFPFRYLTDDYGLTYYAAFLGCSAETEASFKTVAFLAQKVDALDLPAVLTIDGSDPKLAQAVINATRSKSARILTMDSMQSGADPGGQEYLAVMEENLAVLKAALS